MQKSRKCTEQAGEHETKLGVLESSAAGASSNVTTGATEPLQVEALPRNDNPKAKRSCPGMRALHALFPLHFLAFFFGFAGPSKVASTVREISSSVTPLDTAFRTAFLMRFTAFFCFSFPSAMFPLYVRLGLYARQRAPSNWRSIKISVEMLCVKYLQLSQHYGAALRRWVQIESSPNKSDLSDASRRLAMEIQKKALEERNAAYARMVFHKQNCRTCNETE
jgi:hypothetical protein